MVRLVATPRGQARDLLRGEPNSKVSISFMRDGNNGQTEQEITLTRRLVKLRDVKLATLVGDVKNAPIGYLELSGFSKGAAQELQQAYRYLDSVAEGGLRGVILDMRGNPGKGSVGACCMTYCSELEGSDVGVACGCLRARLLAYLSSLCGRLVFFLLSSGVQQAVARTSHTTTNGEKTILISGGGDTHSNVMNQMQKGAQQQK